jgi:hypothetical protein
MNHPLAVDFAFRGVVQDVEPDQAFEQILMLHSCHRLRLPRLQ